MAAKIKEEVGHSEIKLQAVMAVWLSVAGVSVLQIWRSRTRWPRYISVDLALKFNDRLLKILGNGGSCIVALSMYKILLTF